MGYQYSKNESEKIGLKFSFLGIYIKISFAPNLQENVPSHLRYHMML